MAPEPLDQLLPERVTMGLLPYINAHALDEDYSAAAEKRNGSGAEPPPTSRRKVGRSGAAVLAVFAVLTVTAAVQTSRNAGTDERERQELISQVKERKATIDAQRRRITGLQAENSRLESTLFRNSDDSNGVLGRVSLLSLRSGLGAARGPGVEVIADDAPHATEDKDKVLDTDLQKLVNGLWEAGAEAISINGQRLTALTAIRHAGTAITVNFVSLSRPYRILAIGNQDQLPARFAETTSGQAWLDLQHEVGLQFSIRPESSLRLPGADMPQLSYVELPGTAEKNRKGDQ